MYRSRILRPDVFVDPDLAALPAQTRLLYLALHTIVDREGRVLDDPRRIKALCLPYDDLDEGEVNAHLDMLCPIHAVRYEANGQSVLQLQRFTGEQKVHPREAISVLPTQGQPKANLGAPTRSTSTDNGRDRGNGNGTSTSGSSGASVSASVSTPSSTAAPTPASVSLPRVSDPTRAARTIAQIAEEMTRH